MRIVNDFPPNYDAIKAVFPNLRPTVIFAWGETIFNPAGNDVPPHLVAHEEVHGHRQGGDVEGWWERYLAEPDFRAYEELIAHKVEYDHLIANGNRHDRRRALKMVAGRLSSPMYGRVYSLADAKRLLKLEIKMRDKFDAMFSAVEDKSE